ncbi:CoA ester lyase [Novosphingobium resinovorum]|uniref:Citrate lyase n=1 Tax=Novosphingobium resinovorum TaxID=158500 RepID=A0A031K159_9SPHN|nr:MULTISPECIES: CoA ester lyase [Novosphingobium]AOR78874.1 citrate lyase [Novosphingobium resinovorum]EZP82955.1 putative citrate lyase beta chain [Novosphingobium resinovorum]MBF7014400.1 CoA ester lyase [Novosphingobium sp. HR1a]WJM25116.1 CoA ester lyase [Novosphingobium resinovorum]
MRLRSLLFVPGDSEKKFAKASQTAADVLILDLEDSVAPAVKPEARGIVAGWLDRAGEVGAALFVRPNPLDSGLIDDDLAAVVRPGLAGLLVPKANGAEDIAEIARKLDRLEAEAGMAVGTVKIAVVSTETPLAMFNLQSYTPPHPRLVGLTWGAEDLGAAIGATDNKEPDGSWTFPYQVARAQCLFASASAGVVPIDTLYANFRDPEGLEVDCRKARRDGFLGRIAIHPDQVDTINRCFSPSEEEVAHARRIVDAFAANPELGTIGIDGKMFDIPHLKAAHKTLAAAGEDG